MVEACLAHDVEHVVALRHRRYAQWQVTVSATVVRLESSHPWNNVQCVEVVEPFYHRVARCGKFYHTQHAPGRQHAVHLLKTLLQVLKVAYAKCHCHSIKLAIPERHVKAVGLQQGYRVAHATLLNFALRHIEHSPR